MKWFSKAV
jgi:hypothetical protein